MSPAAVPGVFFFFPYVRCIIASMERSRLLLESSNLETLGIMISLQLPSSLSLSSPFFFYLSLSSPCCGKRVISFCFFSPARFGLCQLGLSALGFLLSRYDTFVRWSKNYNSSSFAREASSLFPFSLSCRGGLT